jgi:phosphatidylglycerol---prolipoprotein diacylglyceryl transferase
MDVGNALLVHAAFEMAGIGVGMRLFAGNLRGAGSASLWRGPAFTLVLGCLLGAIIGSKLAVWLEYPHLVRQYWGSPLLVFTGQSIVGGLIGGVVGVEIAKRIAGIRRATGDHFVLPLVVGISIGRIGCFLAGLHDDTYGLPTSLPWGVDFGDGVPRHPTQLYEIGFVAALGAVLVRLRPRLSAEPGLMFKLFLASYLVWRLLIDFLKPLPYAYVLGLSGIQLLAAIWLAWYIPLAVWQLRRLK